MELVKLTEKEFKKFALNHPQANFYQTIEWGHLKETNNWCIHLLGLKDKNKIVAGCMLLSKMTPIKRKMFYAPRGFLIDYNDYDLLKEFTNQIKDYVKKEKGIFIKIDPNIKYQQRDIDGNIVENGENNYQAYENLIKLNYKHFGFNLMQETLQPRWIYVIPTKGISDEEILANMDQVARKVIRRNEKNHIKCREIGYDELEEFKSIMQHTGDRRGFIDRPLSYYQNMYSNLSKSNMIKVLLVELHVKESIETMSKEKEEIEKDRAERQRLHDEKIVNMKEDKYLKKIEELTNSIEKLDKKIEEMTKIQETSGDVLVLGGVLFIPYGKEVLALLGGSYKEYMNFESAYNIYFELIKYASHNGYERCNLYGITGDFSESNPLYNLYSFKRKFGGTVEELIGEFDLVINKPLYLVYKVAFSLYHGVKNIKNKITRK